MESPSEIAQFFDGKSVFLTGVTGFLGKALVEKLLRRCPGVRNIFVLIRQKRGCEGKSRLESILNGPLFELLKSKDPDALSKVVLIPGDMTLPNLGMSPEDEAVICEQVSIIIHSAATVKFDESLKKSIQINVEGTKKIIELAKRVKQIEAVVHVSTAYSNCDRAEIKEEVYPINIDPDNAIVTFESMSDELVNAITPNFIKGKPNTYTYTKHLAERLVSKNRKDVPICIVRPSIVAATSEEPIPGWVDNLNGPSGIFVACGKGILQSLLCYTDNKLDVIPLDHVVSLIVAAAWKTSQAKLTGSLDLEVYNCCSGAENPFYLSRTIPWAQDAFWNTPFNAVVWFPGPLITTIPTLNHIADIFFHFIPAHMLDLKARLCGEKPLMLFIYSKVQAGVLALRYFCTTEFNFSTDNTRKLYQSLGPVDKSMFMFDIKQVSWQSYMHSYIYGLRKYVLKEKDSDLVAARKHLRRMYVVKRITKIAVCILFVIAVGFLAAFVNRVMIC